MNNIENVWRNLLHHTLSKGSLNQKDDAEVIEIIGVHQFIDSSYANVPYSAIVTANQFSEAVRYGTFDIDGYPLKSEALADYVMSIEDDDKIYLTNDDSFVYTYPERLRNYYPHKIETDDEYLNAVSQLDVILERLIDNPGSNRAIAITYIPHWDWNRTDIPCLQIVQGLIRDNQLTLSVFFRSNDLYGAFPSNMMFLTYLGMRFCDVLREYYPSILFKGIDYHCSSLHIYKTDLKQAEKIIEGGTE